MRQRRLMNQINVVPYIDVMLVLLVIFMVTAPMIQPGTVNLPNVDTAAAPPSEAMIVTIKDDSSYTLRRTSNAPEESLEQKALIREVGAETQAHPDRAVVIAADKSVRYELVMNTLNDLRNAGVSKVGLQTQKSGS